MVRVGAGDTTVRIEDSNIGIFDVDVKRLGEPFFRIPHGSISVMANPFDGTGLDVAISNRLMRKMSAAFAIERERGKGTSVSPGLRERRSAAAVIDARCA
jgi:signal transduction histidine kinase